MEAQWLSISPERCGCDTAPVPRRRANQRRAIQLHLISLLEFMQSTKPYGQCSSDAGYGCFGGGWFGSTGMSAAEAHAFCGTVDWSSTLVIPIPQNGGSSRTISVDGVNGTLIEMAPRDNFVGRYLLVWVKDGVVYSVGGKGSAGRALAAAASLELRLCSIWAQALAIPKNTERKIAEPSSQKLPSLRSRLEICEKFSRTKSQFAGSPWRFDAARSSAFSVPTEPARALR